MSKAADRDSRLVGRGAFYLKARLAFLESACRGVEFVGDLDGVVAELVKALTFITRDVHCEFNEDREIISAARAALSRVRLADDGAEKGETK